MVHHNNTNKRPFVSGVCSAAGLCLVFLFVGIFSSGAHAQETFPYSLIPNKDRCVVLRQGQTCYDDIVINFQAPAINNYCLFTDSNNTPFQCLNQQQGQFKIDFESDSDVTYSLRLQSSSTDLANVTIQVVWVYEPKKGKKRGFRLF